MNLKRNKISHTSPEEKKIKILEKNSEINKILETLPKSDAEKMLTAFELMKQLRRRLPWALALKEIGELRRGKDV